MGKFIYDPVQHGDQSKNTEQQTPSEDRVEIPQTGQVDDVPEEDYNVASQERLEHLIRTARRNKVRLPGSLRSRVARLLERLTLIYTKRFPGRRIHNYQSIPPPPKPRSS